MKGFPFASALQTYCGMRTPALQQHLNSKDIQNILDESSICLTGKWGCRGVSELLSLPQGRGNWVVLCKMQFHIHLWWERI